VLFLYLAVLALLRWHIGDDRLCDSYGKLSPGGAERGFWEFTPTSLLVLANRSKPQEQKKAAK